MRSAVPLQPIRHQNSRHLNHLRRPTESLAWILCPNMTVYISHPEPEDEDWIQDELKTLEPLPKSSSEAETLGPNDTTLPSQEEPSTETEYDPESQSLDVKRPEICGLDRRRLCIRAICVAIFIIQTCLINHLMPKWMAAHEHEQSSKRLLFGYKERSQASTPTKTETVTATVTEKATSTVKLFDIPSGAIDAHWQYMYEGCASTQIANHVWHGCLEEGENIDDVIERVMKASRQ
jgi:hypothetical protein